MTGTLNVQNIDVQTVGVAGNATVGGTLTVQTIDLAGNMTVASAGDVVLSDCAECFEVSGSDPIEPGTVMAIDDQGGLRPSGQSYDKRVAGVVSGAGNYRPAIVLGGGSGLVTRSWSLWSAKPTARWTLGSHRSKWAIC